MKIKKTQLKVLIRESIYSELEDEEEQEGIPKAHASHIESMWQGVDAYGNFDPGLRRQAWSLIQAMKYDPAKLKIWEVQLWGGSVIISRSIPALSYLEIERVVNLFNKSYLMFPDDIRSRMIGKNKKLLIEGVNQNESEAIVYLSDGGETPEPAIARATRALFENKIRQVLKERDPDGKSFQAIFESARENISQNDIQKIESLWWFADDGDITYPHRQVAQQLIEALGIDPSSLRIWTLAYPWGELYEPWTFYGGGGEAPGFTIEEIGRILEYYNSHNTRNGLELSVDERDLESGVITLMHPPGVWYDESETYYVSNLIEKAAFETAQ